MKAFASAAVLASTLLFSPLVLPAQAQTEGMGPVAHEEAAMWDNLKAGNYDGMRAVMAPDFVYVGPEAIGDKEASLAGMKACKLHDYSFHMAQTRMLSPDIALVTYAAHIDTDCGGHPFKGALHCSSTWVRRDDTRTAVIGSRNRSRLMAPSPPC